MSARREELLDELEASIGYRFGNRKLLVEAVTHRSYINEAREPCLRDNQRLEFFGDAVLGLLVSHLLLDFLPASCEGSLSRTRASLVDEKSLAGIADGFHLGKFLILGRGEEKTGGRHKRSVLADAFEALVGAVYLDGGIEAAAELVSRCFEPLLERGMKSMDHQDHKTRLQELSQVVYGMAPRYQTENVAGPDHDRLFTVTARIGERVLGRGVGKSKKEAEQAAAREGLQCMESRSADEMP